MAKQSDDPFRVFLRGKGEVNADTMTEAELDSAVAYRMQEREISVSEFAELHSKRGEWLKRCAAASIKSMSSESKTKLRKMLGDTPAADDDRDYQSELDEMERRLAKKFGLDDPPGRESESLDETHRRLSALNKGAGAELMEMADEAAHQTGGSRITYQKGRDMTTQNVEETFIRLKGAGEAYRTTRHVLKHAKWNEPIRPIRNGVEAEPVEGLSEWEHAKIGAFFKWKLAKLGQVALTEHDRAVLDEMFEKDTFIGYDSQDQLVRQKGIKALINDPTSGGDHLTPAWFDRGVISFPLLHSELLPYVDIVDVPRGAAVETVSIGNPTVIWNNTEGNAQNLFTTTDLVAPITASIFPVAVYLEIGRDLMADSLPMIGRELTNNISQRVAAELDEQITTGDGTTQPQGIMNASGTVNITPAIPTTGPVSVDNLLDLMFGIDKPYRVPAWNPRYVMTDQRYKSHRALATGVTGDARLLHGMSVQSYSLLEAGVSVENTGMQHDYGIFGALKKYRLWRRAGFETRFETGGATLARSNTVLLCGRGRYGGKVVDGNAFAVMTGWPPTV